MIRKIVMPEYLRVLIIIEVVYADLKYANETR